MVGVNRSGPPAPDIDWGQSCAAESQKLRDKYRLLSSEMAKLQAPDLGSRYAANQATRERLTNAYSELSQSWASLKQACAAHGVEIQDLTDPAPRQPSDSNDKTPAPWWETAKDWAASAEASAKQSLRDLLDDGDGPLTLGAGVPPKPDTDPAAAEIKDALAQNLRRLLDSGAGADTDAKLAQGPLSGAGEPEADAPSPFSLTERYATKSETVSAVRTLEQGFKSHLPGDPFPIDDQLDDALKNGLRQNIQGVIEKINDARQKGRNLNFVRIQLANPRFRFLDQVPDARDALKGALSGTEVNIPVWNPLSGAMEYPKG